MKKIFYTRIAMEFVLLKISILLYKVYNKEGKYEKKILIINYIRIEPWAWFFKSWIFVHTLCLQNENT